MNLQFIDEVPTWKNTTLIDFLNDGNIPYGWEKFFADPEIWHMLETISAQLTEEVKKGETIYPPLHQVFRALYEVPLEKVKTMVVGQDVYHSPPGAAIGLCFSVGPSAVKSNGINPSLMSIYREMANCGFERVQDGDLTHWARGGGILMLNAALTVEHGMPESHLHIWYDFTERLIAYVNANTENIVWLLFGSKAQKYHKLGFIDDEKHGVITATHPSPLSAYKSTRFADAFIGSHCFSRANEYLVSKGKTPIEW